MTIHISSGKASALSTAGESNNPLVAYDNKAADGTFRTGSGTVVQAEEFCLTGTTFDRAVVTPTGTNTVILDLDLGAATSINFGAITAHNLADVGATVRLEYQLPDLSWVDNGAGLDVPTDNQAIAWYFNTVSARYWRIRVTNATDDVQIGVWFLGQAVTIPQRLYQGYAPPITPNMVNLQSNVSEGGNLLGSSVIRKGSMAQAGLRDIPDTFIRSTDWKAFQRHFNSGGGFFWAWRPTKYDDLFYAWREGGTIAPTNSGPLAFMSFDLAMRFYDDP